MTNLDRLNKLASGESNWMDKAKTRQKNRAWLKHSQKIAIKLLSTLRDNKRIDKGITNQKQLAEALGVSPQQINKIVKGKENLTLETISKLEQALNISLIFEANHKKSVGISKTILVTPQTSLWTVYNNQTVAKKVQNYNTQISYQDTLVSEDVISYG